MRQFKSNEVINLLVIPTTIFFAVFCALYGYQLDFVLASTLFHLEGGRWSLTNHWFFSDVMHSGTRFLNNIVIANVLGFWLYQKFSSEYTYERKVALTKLVLSLILSFAIVAILKRALPMECPWDLQLFGGEQPFIGLFEKRPADIPTTQCFPAGHASVGYAWVALYFYYLPVSPKKSRTGLMIGLFLGLLLGIVQQIRGAHFFSHDLTTLWLCWSISCAVFWLYPNRTKLPTDKFQGHNYA
jgi:membrane-associated PAP2 superfamily phosphatase